jgi:Holliday junction DNA helicase RuvA
MIATLTGVVAEKLGDVVVVDAGGVGYGVLVAAEDFGRLSSNQTVKVYIYEHIREASHDLYGFCKLDSKLLFEQLLEVNGVGPKMALNVLSVGSTDDVRRAIATGDTKFIQAASGVGKRVAERVVVELKDKVGLSGVDLGAAGLLTSENVLRQDEAVEALIALGFTPADAVQALKTADGSLPTEERVKAALRRA